MFHRLKRSLKPYGIGNVLRMGKSLIPVKNTTPKRILMGEFYANEINEIIVLSLSAHSYKVSMRLTINALNIMDYGQYFCVAKNELNTTMATFEIISEFLLIKYCSKSNGISRANNISCCSSYLLFI